MRTLRRIARAVLPETLVQRLRAIRSRRYQLRLLQREGLLDAAARYVERNGCLVLHGPFAGMIYPKRAALSRHSIPKLLGTYEQELHGVIEVISHRRYEMVIDIGSAEGYYAVGLARMLGTKVLAYDPEPDERRYCEEAARLNGVSSMVELKGLFWRSDIASLRDVRVLCICDCEGFEAHLFNEESTPGTAGWDLLIELHGDAEGRLMNLPWPHRMTTIHSVPRSARFKELEGLGDQAKLLSEYRGSPQTWLWCESLVQQ